MPPVTVEVDPCCVVRLFADAASIVPALQIKVPPLVTVIAPEPVKVPPLTVVVPRRVAVPLTVRLPPEMVRLPSLMMELTDCAPDATTTVPAPEPMYTAALAVGTRLLLQFRGFDQSLVPAPPLHAVDGLLLPLMLSERPVPL